jgi:mannosyltransferase
MTILFDSIIFSLQKVGGISTYWYELISRFAIIEKNLFFIEDNANNNIVYSKFKNNRYKIYRNISPFTFFSRFLNIKAKSFDNPFIFHSSYYRISSNKNAINIVTVHDFIHEKYHKGLRKFIHHFQKSYAIKNANVIIAVSESTKNDLLFYHPKIDINKVKVIYNGVSDDFYNLTQKDNEFSKSFLYIGSREKYKNFIETIDLVSSLESYNLIIVGNNLNKFEFSYINQKLPNNWKLYSKISNHDLNKLYNSVFSLLYLSSYEGFGIPLLEAMKAGCPFIALNSSSIPEVAGNAGILLNNLSINSFHKAINKLTNNRIDIVNEGFSQVSKFSWNKCFEETYKIYKKYEIQC